MSKDEVLVYSVVESKQDENGAKEKKTTQVKYRQISSDTASEGGLKKNFRRLELEAAVFKLYKENKHRMVLELMPELLPIQTNKFDMVHTLLIKTECEVEHGELSTASADIDTLCELMTLIRPTTTELMDLAKENSNEKKYFRAFVLYSAAIRLCKQVYVGDAAVRGMKSCVKSITMIINDLSKTSEGIKATVKDVMIPVLEKTTTDLSEIEGSNAKVRVEQTARCCYDTALCYRAMDDYDSCISLCERGIKLMLEHFGEESKNYQVIGRCLTQIGSAQISLKKLQEAKESLEAALESFESSTDWTTEEQRKKEMKIVREQLKYL